MQDTSDWRDKKPRNRRKYVLPGCIGIVLAFLLSPFWIETLYVGSPRQSHGASCQSNLKQIGLALQQYAQDNDEQTPPLIDMASKQTWREASYSFTKSVDLYRCPDVQRDGQATPEHLPDNYTANVTAWGKAANTNQVITVIDTRGYDGPEWDMTSVAFAPPSNRLLYTHKPRHLFFERPAGRLNCLFGDGHVKSLFPEQTMTPTNLWTRDNAPFTGQELSNARAILKSAE